MLYDMAYDGIVSSCFEFLDLLSRLDEIDKRIVNFIFREGRCTLKQLQRVFKYTELEKRLDELCRQNIIFKYKFLNFEFYELNLKTRKLYYYERFPAGPVIPLIYHFNLLSDKNRFEGLKRAIESIVSEGDVVLDVGCGTGVLSILAAKKGAKVFAVEVDPIVAESAEYFIRNSGFRDKIFLFQGDIRDLEFDAKFDVIICEMLDTALIAELQVPVMNLVVGKYKKESTKILPMKAYTYAQPIYKDYGFDGLEFRLIHYEEYGAKESVRNLGPKILYHVADFRRYNEEEVDVEVVMNCAHDGIVNGIRITTETEMMPGYVVKGSAWFNPPLVLPVEDIKVNRGDKLIFKLSYGLGRGFTNISYMLKEHIRGG